jgi:hypothetical protein
LFTGFLDKESVFDQLHQPPVYSIFGHDFEVIDAVVSIDVVITFVGLSLTHPDVAIKACGFETQV